MADRRTFLALAGALLTTGCATGLSLDAPEPIVFVHGNGDSAALWETTIWRFESNGWPRDRLHAIDLPYPMARDDDAQPQPGKSSVAENTEFLAAAVDRVLKATGARQVIVMGNSRGGYPIRNYIQNGGGAAKVSHAILSGVPNHGVWNLPGRAPGSEFAGNGPFLQALNQPKNANGDEVTGPVKWLTIRSDGNDKYAQPKGRWIGDATADTGVSFEGPALKGATNVVIPRIDHRETAYSPAAFEAAYRFITGKAPATLQIVPEEAVVLSGMVTGLGVKSTDPASGNFANNLALPGAQLQIFAIDATTGARRGDAAYSKVIGDDGRWGPFAAQHDTRYEFVVAAQGYATTHVYRSPFRRSSSVVNLRPERLAEFDKPGPALVIFTRPRGYFDADRDRMLFDRRTPPPLVVQGQGAGVSASRTKPEEVNRPVMGEFNGEKVIGRTWPTASNEVTVLELTY
ncbi:alpha/beta fold hydrolase [Ramlibacter sp.]|uniref:alpha/beta fold hydrolase n=1 Tax=Ramlibacter sp. TaxID=1917967 RepID=UPI002601F73F|nr:alpha/beta fold hydrolase [Ramlibacter sp.]